MGNRATVIFTNRDVSDFSAAVYLHWNGGPDSIYAFLNEMDRRGIRTDLEYEAARFVHIVGDFFDMKVTTALFLGVSNGPTNLSDICQERFDPGDNGVYLVDRTGGKMQNGTVRVYRVSNGKTWSGEKVQEEKEKAIRSDSFKNLTEALKKLRKV